jgi:hypothetical protein
VQEAQPFSFDTTLYKNMKRKEPLRCKNCKLYDKKEGVCTVTVVRDGEKFELPTRPNDECFWEKNGVEIQEIKVWSDGKNGYVKTTDPNLDIKVCQ